MEAEVPGGDIEAAVVGHLALPGAGEGGQQSLAPCNLLKGFMEGSTVLVELWGSRGVGLSPGTPSTDHKMGMGSPLPQDSPGLGILGDLMPPGSQCRWRRRRFWICREQQPLSRGGLRAVAQGCSTAGNGGCESGTQHPPGECRVRVRLRAASLLQALPLLFQPPAPPQPPRHGAARCCAAGNTNR